MKHTALLTDETHSICYIQFISIYYVLNCILMYSDDTCGMRYLYVLIYLLIFVCTYLYTHL